MQPVLLVQKGKTSQQFDGRSRRIPTTVLTVEKIQLADIKTAEKDGYTAIKLAIGQAKRIDKPTQGTLQKKGITQAPRIVREIRTKNTSTRIQLTTQENTPALTIGEATLATGSAIEPDMLFKVGDMVDVTGVSKGKGFQGVVKRHGFKGGPKTHGQSDRWRSPGSMGMTTTPGRTFKGKRMAGRMGADQVTIKHLEVVAVSKESLTVKGLVPGNVGTDLVVRLAREAV